MYVIGAGIRKFRPQIHPLLAGALALVTVGLMGLFSIISTDEGFSKGFTQGYGSFWVTLTGTMVFLALYRVELSGTAARVVRWMAGGCFEGYLLSRLFDVWVYTAAPTSWRQPEKYWLCFLAITLPVFLASIFLGNVTHWGAVKLSNWLFPKRNTTVNS